ncbi:MAG TPA: hypothetical protein VM096_11815 [Vicinamibacterales bacterium]|nr:hypothetical protein [Vicinamibacterales bacterium]
MPLTPAETLLAPEILRAIAEQAPLPDASPATTGTDPDSDVLITCRENQCGPAMRAGRRISALVGSKKLAQPIRSIRVVSTVSPVTAARAKAAIHVAEVPDVRLQIVRSLWSHPGIADEVVEIFARQNGTVEARPFEAIGQLALEPFGISSTTIVVNPAVSNDRAAVVAATAAYFLATLPNSGSEAMLSHLTVGAHARLAEDGRKAVAQMGNQQRASADVLIMFGHAIEREQRRMRSLEKFMPAPVDPMLHGRILDMENSITSVWTSMGITSSPFVPAAERIRGRGGEDRRIVTRTGTGPLPTPEPPTAMLKYPNVDIVIYELGNFIDGTRSISDIRDAVSAEFEPIALPVVVDYFERLAKAGAVSIK